jgi:ABC-type multidrug transport system fused ATPase/permease subunit
MFCLFALDATCFMAHELERVSGTSGGGKSSIHSLLLRYYDPVRGKVTYDGQGAPGLQLI